MKKLFSTLVVLLMTSTMQAQYQEPVRRDTSRLQPLKGLEYKVEMQGSLSKGKTPLWLNANKYGLSSLENSNGYIRTAVIRPLSVDEGRKWGIGYWSRCSSARKFIQVLLLYSKLFIEGRLHHGTLTIGTKEQPMELKK